MKIKLLIVPCILLLTVFATVGCMVTTEPAAIANPASEYCVEQGGTVDIREDGDGGQVGYCQFDDGSECEEWAFLRSDCTPGEFPSSARIANPAAEYCVAQGGVIDTRENANGGQVSYCQFDDGSECEEWDFFRSECAPESGPPANMANPATVFCGEQGGAADLREDADGGQIGYCLFDDGSECEEWAFFRGDCAPGEFPSSTNIANPASENCLKQGGTVVVQQRDDGGGYGVCIFEDNRQCEEWAMLRETCPVGGVKITGYATQAAQYCAITGGSYEITDSSADEEQGSCTLPDGQTCDVWAYFQGECRLRADN